MGSWREEEPIGIAGCGGRCAGTGGGSCIRCGGLLVCDEAACVVCGVCGGGCSGAWATRAACCGGGDGGGLGAAVAEDRSRFVVMATDMIIGGGMTGAVCVMVMWTIGSDAGTKVICGRVGIGGAGGVTGIC